MKSIVHSLQERGYDPCDFEETLQETSCTKVLASEETILKVYFDLDPYFAQNNLYYSELLRDITPPVLDFWQDEGVYYIVAERYWGSMWDLAHEQSDEFEGRLTFTRSQIAQMRHLCSKISERGVVHGDLKAENFVYRKNEKGCIEIALIDFDMSQDVDEDEYDPHMGWLEKFAKNKKSVGNAVKLPHINHMQLEIDIISSDFYNENGDRFSWPLFRDIPSEERALMMKYFIPHAFDGREPPSSRK